MCYDAVKSDELTLMAAQTTASGTNTDTYGEAQWNSKHKGLMVFVPRTGDGGIATLDMFLQALKPGGDESDNADWFDVTLGIITQYADGETGTYIGIVYPGITAQDTSLDETVTTTGKKVRQTSGYLPRRYRLRMRNGGTTVTNTIGTVVGVELP